MRERYAAYDYARVQLAVAMFCLSAAKQIAALIAALAGVDMIVFTGGIGEHTAVVRAKICNQVSWIGLRLEPATMIKTAGQRKNLPSAQYYRCHQKRMK